VPLHDAGLSLEGSDISPAAIEQLKQRRPEANVKAGDFLTHNTEKPYAYLLSIQLFQHGNSRKARRLFEKTYDLLQPRGLFVLRVNSIHTQIAERHEITERSPEGGLTVKYISGQKTGMDVHFFSAEELHELTRRHYKTVMPLREEFIPRADKSYWVQWETILEKI
jgi:cyclopropane fatty-acyl-phospholipid synthase-like methyltransferase